MRSDLPAGTVTFLFTDIEGSTRLLHELGERYVEVRAEHHRAIRAALAAHAGVEVDTQGDAFFAAFARASNAVGAAAEIQRELAAGPIRVRIGVHTGEPTVTDEGYVGVDVHHAARICAAGHGGQVLLSQTTRDLAEVEVRDLGEHRLKDLTLPVRLYQLGHAEFAPLKTLHRTNLPAQPTLFVGRDRELRDVVSLMRRHRLVTLTGPGGSGKTRLALQAGAEVADDFRDGVWFVPLAGVSDAPAVPEEIGRVLNVTRLPEDLRTKQALLLLDNLEHLLEFAPQVAESLSVAPELSILCTSRERLAISAEQEYQVPTLPVDEAVELFAQRARQWTPGFKPDEHVQRLVRRLDGLPLAIELAAARTKLLTPIQILDRLGGTVDLLASSMCDVAARQRSLRATLDWSYGLLGPEERRLFGALAVFAGGFSLEAAETICDADVESLGSLVDKSLVARDERGRFSLLETLREYAQEVNAAASDEDTSQRHARYYLQVVEEFHLKSRPDQRKAFGWFATEHDNFRAALTWMLDRGDTVLALRFCVALRRFWYLGNSTREGGRWLERALGDGAATEPKLYAQGLYAAGFLAFYGGDNARAAGRLSDALRRFRQLGDRFWEAEALRLLSYVEQARGSLGVAKQLVQQSLDLHRERGEPHYIARALQSLGELEGLAGAYEDAGRLIDEAIALARQHEDLEVLVDALAESGDVALDQGNLDDARERYRESLNLSLEVRGPGIGYALAGLAATAAKQNDLLRAGRLWGAVEKLEETWGFRLLNDLRTRYERTVTTCASSSVFVAGIREGRESSLEEAVAYALRVVD